MRGRVASATDILVQRFLAVETAICEGNWSLSRHLEVIPDSGVSAMPDKERHHIFRRQREELRVRSSGRGEGSGPSK